MVLPLAGSWWRATEPHNQASRISEVLSPRSPSCEPVLDLEVEAVLVCSVWLPVAGGAGDFGFISTLTHMRSAEPTMGGSSGFLGGSSLAASCSSAGARFEGTSPETSSALAVGAAAMAGGGGSASSPAGGVGAT